MDQNVFDAIVVGAGVMGCSTAYHLAKAGKKTALVEQFPVLHSRGSSCGHSRITRLANDGISSKTAIMQSSFKDWFKIEQASGITLFVPNPLISVAPRENEAFVDRMVESSISCGGEARRLPIEQINAKYRSNFPATSVAAEDKTAGVLLADQCLRALIKLFEQEGGILLDRFPVTAITSTNSGWVSVESPHRTLKASRVAICGGPWASKILQPLGISLPLQPEKIGVFYWRMKEKVNPLLFIEDTPTGHFFAIPEIEFPNMIKCGFHAGANADPDHRDKSSIDGVRELIKKYVTDRFPCLEPVPAIEETGMYTNTPDREMIVDFHPTNPSIVYACGFSGTGFKIAPSVGQVLTAMCCGQPVPFNMYDFRASRFGSIPQASRL